MSDSKIVSLGGAEFADSREPNSHLIEALEGALERARSGETIGCALVELYNDRAAGSRVAGRFGGYSMLGAMEMVRMDIIEANRDEDF